jgi:hypothetical protein
MRFRPVAAVALLALTAVPANAQLGGLMKKVKEKAVQAAAEKAGLDTKAPGSDGAAPTFDDVTVELTAARVESLLKGLQAAQAVLTENGGIAAVMKQREAVEAQIKSLDERANAVSSGYHAAHSRWKSCESDVRKGLEKSHEDQARQAMAAMVANPQLAAEKGRAAAAMQQEMSKAIAANDSTAAKKAMMAYYKYWGVDLTKDDAFVVSKCGALPLKPQAMVDLETANARRDSIDVQARAIETRAVLEGSRASGLSEQAFAMARERAQMAATGTRSRFTKAELAAIDAKKSELLVYLKP